MRMRRAITAARRFVVGDERGAAMVEFALVAGVIFIPLVFGTIEFGRLISAKTTITAAAREGVRFAIVRGSASGAAGGPVADSAAVANYVMARTQLSPITVKSTWTGAKDPGDTVTVQVTYVYTPVVPVISPKTITSISKQNISY